MTEIERLLLDRERLAKAARDGVSSAIDALSRAAFDRMWELLTGDTSLSPRDAVLQAQKEFGGEFTGALAQAFSTMLQESIGATAVRSLPVGDITLSRHLYLHATQTAGEVAALVKEHAKGIAQARDLSRRLYDGYSPQDGVVRPLEGRARALLPKALRSLTEDLPTRRELTALQVAGQQQAERLKSPALRAAYLEAFDSWEAGAGQEALKKRLKVAQFEKNRFFADRIAQTELHRAHQAQVALDLVADVETTVVQVRMSPSHPRVDICDLHARANLWGLGAGNYPKAEAPVPPFHPFCACRLRSMPSLDATGAQRVPGGEVAYLRSIGPLAAARVMGSKARAQRALGGESARVVADGGKPEAYRTATVGEVPKHPLVTPPPSP